MTATKEIDAALLKQAEEAKTYYLEKFPQRVVKTEGFERLFSHYTGFHGDELMKYLEDFQTKALKVCSLENNLVDLGSSLWMYSKWRVCRFEGTCPQRVYSGRRIRK